MSRPELDQPAGLILHFAKNALKAFGSMLTRPTAKIETHGQRSNVKIYLGVELGKDSHTC